MMLVGNKMIIWPMSVFFINESVSWFCHTEGWRSVMISRPDMFEHPQMSTARANTETVYTVYLVP